MDENTDPLLRNEVHLQKAIVRFALDLDQIWDLSRRIDLRKINPLGRLASSLSESIRAALKRIIDHINVKAGC
jgi:hypothetical protein